MHSNDKFTTEDTEDAEFFSLFPSVKQSDKYDYKYVRLCVTYSE